MIHSSRGDVQSFLAGAVCSATLLSFIYLYQRASDARTRRIESNPIDDDATARPVEKIRMDSCSLDQRMIRKAEGAIRNRTSRLIVVIERCTNDHNYSAILRTVEALGVQHVYIIAPQCIQSTLTTNNEDDKEDGDVKVLELKRSSGQLVKRATESEIKDRAMHHLYAKKATEWLTVTGKRSIVRVNVRHCVIAMSHFFRLIQISRTPKPALARYEKMDTRSGLLISARLRLA